MNVCNVIGCCNRPLGGRKTCYLHRVRCDNTIDGKQCLRSVYSTSNKCVKCLGIMVLCEVDGCQTYARSGKKRCCSHTQVCVVDDCTTPGIYNGYCSKHTPRLKCQQTGCNKLRRSSFVPYCVKHGGGIRCEFNGCNKIAQNNSGNMCMAHFKKTHLSLSQKTILEDFA